VLVLVTGDYTDIEVFELDDNQVYEVKNLPVSIPYLPQNIE